MTRNKLELSRYLHDKFTFYVKDKAIQESVLETNPIPEVKPKVDDYLDEIFEPLGKSYGRESDGILSKSQTGINNVMGPNRNKIY